LSFIPIGLTNNPAVFSKKYSSLGLLKNNRVMIYNIILVFHIVAGFTALTTGMMAIITTKGSKSHLLSGKCFIIGMYLVGFSAIVMSTIKFNSFLMAVGVFSMYLTFTGKQSITFYRRKTDYQVQFKDQLPAFIALFTSLWMIMYPVSVMIVQGKIFVSILLVFGLILFFNSAKDIYILSSNERTRAGHKIWLIKHIGLTGGAYISATTAFLVNNIQLDPAWITWLAPTVIGSVLLALATQKWRNKFKIVA